MEDLLVKKAIVSEVEREIKEEAENKETLQYLNPSFKINECHRCVKFIRNPREVRRTCVKMQMLTGTYPLQATRAKLKQTSDPRCQICKTEEEDLVHCLILCPETQSIRKEQMPRVLNSIPYVLENLGTILHTPRLMTQLIIDLTHPHVTGLMTLPKQCEEKLERAARNFCFAIHLARCHKLCI